MALSISQSGSLTLTVDGNSRISGATGGAIIFSASGGTAPYRFEIVAGSLAPGMVMDSAGYIKGQALQRGAALVRVRATDSASPPNFTDSDQTLVVS